MKKTTSKLSLNKTTLRTLGAELHTVRGAGDAVEGLTTVLKDLTPFTANCPVSGFCRNG